ncbi:polyketide cyclase [Geodermatophilus sp. Leaf369]|uniref:SRPBCC family protein n=1 Tax=Geodermatophilus sp. Leaf369 TaxID=1736354 RepID=UPI0006F2B5A9|nr:SRPBCC family protein [Geodermatophilus sp. Leaf369]KQS58356.1 polyketide cyclase [Geodermatophilus sp. Leaf369]QNG36820.1 polyketide cyclase [Geodermatophilaceae bacterium NBWT11]
MPTVERTFVVQCPLEKAVDYLADFAHAEAWDPGTKSCTPVDGQPVQVGSRWRNVSEFMGRETELEYRLATWEADRLVLVGENKTVTSTDEISFRAVDATSTEIRYHVDFDFHGVASLAGPLLKPALEKLGTDTEEQMTRVLATV